LVNIWDAWILEPLPVHLFLTLGGLLTGILVSLPLAILCIYNKKLSFVIINIANLLQAFPSFAFLALVVSLLGLGYTPAIIAIIFRALLPIIKNTYLGLATIDPKIIEFAQGLGLTQGQILRNIRFPNAYPAIFAGIKFASILANGIAVLSVIIGSGGYGEIIFPALNQFNMTKLIIGVLPVIIISICLDITFTLLERRITPIPLQKKSAKTDMI
jgi:osmoprotectant transport system permease protein